MLSVFGSDRAFLVYPCDPDAPSFEVAMERARALIAWWLEQGPGVVRLAGALVLAIGGFVDEGIELAFRAVPPAHILDGDHIKLPEDPTTNSAISEFAWIANLSEGTVSKVSTVTGMEVARYYTGPPIDGDYTHLFPWTTVVDEAGNCWVANWATGHVGSVTEILAEGGIDRDGSGTIKTSKDLTPPYGEISKSEMYEWGQDERVIRHYLVGSTNGAPDALVLDKTGKLWIGLFNENKIVQVDPNLPPADYAPGGTPRNVNRPSVSVRVAPASRAKNVPRCPAASSARRTPKCAVDPPSGRVTCPETDTAGSR